MVSLTFSSSDVSKQVPDVKTASVLVRGTDKQVVSCLSSTSQVPAKSPSVSSKSHLLAFPAIWLPVIHLVLLRLPLFTIWLSSRCACFFPPLDLCDGSCLYLSVAASSGLPNLTGVSNPHSTSVVPGRSGQVELAPSEHGTGMHHKDII